MAGRHIVRAQLDAETRRVLERLRRSTGLDDSAIVRRALRWLAVVERTTPRVISIGKFGSGRPDLGSNAAHLRAFGRAAVRKPEPQRSDQRLDRAPASDSSQHDRAICATHRARLARQARALVSGQAKP